MQKIKAELQELQMKINLSFTIKYKTEEQKNNMVLNKAKITSNDNELTLFRQECLKLYEKIEQKNKENQQLKFTLEESKKTNEFLEQQIKGLMKKLKFQEIEKQQQPTPSAEQIFCTTAPTNQFSNALNYLKSFLKENQQTINQNQIYHYLYQNIITLQLENYLVLMIIKIRRMMKQLIRFLNMLQLVFTFQRNIHVCKFQNKNISISPTQIEQKYQKQIQALNQKANNLLISQNKKSVIRSDLESFFLDCVETVRRDILKKKRPFGNNQQLQTSIESIPDFSQFHKEDKLKILELVGYNHKFLYTIVSNEKILVFLYQKLFPNHINLVIKSIKEDIKINNFLDQSLKYDSSNNNHKSGDYKIDIPKTTREVRSASLNKQLEVKKGKLLFKQY